MAKRKRRGLGLGQEGNADPGKVAERKATFRVWSGRHFTGQADRHTTCIPHTSHVPNIPQQSHTAHQDVFLHVHCTLVTGGGHHLKDRGAETQGIRVIHVGQCREFRSKVSAKAGYAPSTRQRLQSPCGRGRGAPPPVWHQCTTVYGINAPRCNQAVR